MAELEGEREEQQEFLSIAAHDLRSPLAAIRGYAQLLLRQAGPGQRRRRATGCRRSYSRRTGWPDLTETGAGRGPRAVPAPGPAASDGRPGAGGPGGRAGPQGSPGPPGSAGPALVLRLAEALPRVQGDLARLSQIVRALLQYALARTPDGAAVTVAVHPDAGDEAGPPASARRRGRGGDAAGAGRGAGAAGRGVPGALQPPGRPAGEGELGHPGRAAPVRGARSGRSPRRAGLGESPAAPGDGRAAPRRLAPGRAARAQTGAAG